MQTLYWHDYETFGSDPRRDRAAQFAGQRTDEALQPVGEPLVIYCQPSNDYLPQPEACLITGITPQKAQRHGIPEPQFVEAILNQLGDAQTCGIGYNSIRFDDEFTRNLLFRNFQDPYEREWKNGNSRWDLIDVVRLTYALRPAGIEWPLRDDGSPSFRLQHLTAANNLDHAQAHDAMSDVNATIALARLLQQRQPKLFHYCFNHRRKREVTHILNLAKREPLLHVSARYPAQRGCLAMILPLAAHPTNPNGVIVFDLMSDPTPLLTVEAELLADRLFTPSADLPPGIERLPLKTVHVNRAPILAPLSVLKHTDTARIGLDVARCRQHLAQLLESKVDLTGKIRSLFDAPFVDRDLDPEHSLYHGPFASSGDRALMQRVHNCKPEALADLSDHFDDPRYAELLFRFRARHHPDTLNAKDRARWQRFRQQQLTRPLYDGLSHSDIVLEKLTYLRTEHAQEPGAIAILDQLESYVRSMVRDL